jgi:hypothetical protein
MTEHLQDKIKVMVKNFCDLPVCGKSRGANVTYVAVFVGSMERPQDLIQRPYYTVPAQCHRKLDEVESLN